MRHFSIHFSRFFSFRKLRKFVLLLSLSALVLLVYYTLFTDGMDPKQILNSVLRLSPPKLQSIDEVVEPTFSTQAEQKEPSWKSEYQGQANMHVFEDWCGSSVGKLRESVLYPLFPHYRTTVSRLAIHPKWNNYGVRIFGYIHPPKSGDYIFAISSDKNSEFWLSFNESTKSLKLLVYVGKMGNEWSAPGEYGKFASQISKPVLQVMFSHNPLLLKDMRYFFEVIYKQSEGMDHLEVAWRLNQKNSIFSIITSEYLSLYTNESSILMAETAHIPQTAASHEVNFDDISNKVSPVVDMVREDPRDVSYRIPLMSESYLQNVFPECDYKPSYIFQGSKMERFKGVYYVRYTSVYPNDYTRQTHAEETCFYKQDKKFAEGGFAAYMETEDSSKEEKEKEDLMWKRVFNVNPVEFQSKQTDVVHRVCRTAGSNIMDEKDVMPVVEAVMNQLQTTHGTSDLVLRRVLNVEMRKDAALGGRYLLELELEDSQGQTMLLSRYFYLPNATNNENNKDTFSPTVCSPKGFSWNTAARVNVILTVKNQGRWVIQFIRQMEKVYRHTRDKNFNIIIVDFCSDDIDIEKALRSAILPSYQYKKLDGAFQRSKALQAAIDLVEDDNSILFTCDLHLHFPVSIINSVRKHTIQGKMAFVPVVMRLECGVSAKAPKGFWEINGYGLIGIYKSDMKRVGGMNTVDFKYKWGGEDWELLDRILENKLEVERLNVRNFLHYFHTRRGMWDNKQ